MANPNNSDFLNQIIVDTRTDLAFYLGLVFTHGGGQYGKTYVVSTHPA